MSPERQELFLQYGLVLLLKQKNVTLDSGDMVLYALKFLIELQIRRQKYVFMELGMKLTSQLCDKISVTELARRYNNDELPQLIKNRVKDAIEETNKKFATQKE